MNVLPKYLSDHPNYDKSKQKMKPDVLNLVMVLMWNNSAFLAFVLIYVREKDPNGLSNIIHLELDS